MVFKGLKKLAVLGKEKLEETHSLHIANVYHFETVSASLKFRALTESQCIPQGLAYP